MRGALRTFRRSPGFTAGALLSLALAIGANTAIFSLMNALMLRSLPVAEPARLVEFLNQYPGDPPLNVFSRTSFEYFRDRQHVFSNLTGMRPAHFTVRGDNLEPETVDGEAVVGNFFEMLGVKPAIGRLIAPGDAAVAVASWSWWKNKFNLDPGVVGRRIVVDDRALTVVGVTPREFSGLHVGLQPDIWVTLGPAAEDRAPLQLIARLRPGVSIEQARAEMAVLFRWTLEERSAASQDPAMRQLKFTVEPAGAGLATGLRGHFAKPLLALMAVVGLLLSIACINLANMLLARGAGRRQELAVRVALGASRSRILRLVLTESLMLSAAGAAAGVVLAYFGAGALARMMTSGRPIIGLPARIEIDVRPDAHVLLFTAVVALLTGLLFGAAPAWNALASGPLTSLREIGRVGGTRFTRLAGRSLVVAQVALSVGLLSAAGLFIRHLANIEEIDLGFRRDHVLLVKLDPTRSGYSGAQLSRAYQDLLGGLEAIPGVRSATLSAPTPLSGAAASRFVNVEGHAEPPADRRYISVSWIAPKYFQTFGTPLLVGRDFTFEDRGRPPVAIVNQAMARYYFGDGNPLGRSFTFDGEDRPYEIVGVAGDAKYQEIREDTHRTVYLDTFQFPQPATDFAIRTHMPPEAMGPAVRRTVRAALKTVAVARMATLAGQVDASIVPERLIATLSGMFGALGSLLAAIGVYGLLAYTVARRTREIGIRIALGATPRAIARMVLGEALGLSCAGLLIGALIAWWGQRLAGSFSPDLPTKSAFPIAFASVSMLAIALAAAYVPARRGARVDPMEALRHE
jgi:predicted permease